MGFDAAYFVKLNGEHDLVAAAERLVRDTWEARHDPSVFDTIPPLKIEADPRFPNYWPQDVVEFSSFYVGTGRWYGDGGGRGHWPDNLRAILALREVFPGCEVYYGHQETDVNDLERTADLATDEFLTTITDYWNEHGCDHEQDDCRPIEQVTPPWRGGAATSG